jgi:hypothetical protein
VVTELELVLNLFPLIGKQEAGIAGVQRIRSQMVYLRSACFWGPMVVLKFRDNILIPSSRVKKSKKRVFLDKPWVA